jgi:hypothetical protein
MLKATIVFTAIMAIIVMCQVTAVVVSADELDNPSNAYPTTYGTSIVSENYYVLVNEYGTPGNYDISYDGNTCHRWITSSVSVVVSNPTVITYTTPVDDFDLVHIIACESITY